MGRNSKQYLCSTKTKLSSGYGEVSDKLNIEQPLKYGREAIKKIAKYWTSFIIDVIFISEEVLNFQVIGLSLFKFGLDNLFGQAGLL